MSRIPHRRPRHARLRPQRRRLRGAGGPAGGRRLDARARTPRTPPSPSSTPAGSSSRRRRTRSTPCSRPPTCGTTPRRPRRRSSPSAAWPSATARSWPASLPEADAVLGFDSYADLSAHLDAILARRAAGVARAARPAHAAAAGARRAAGAGRQAPTFAADVPDLPAELAPASGPRVVRRRLDGRPWAPLKLASGCDRRCSFCAIPAFRGAFVSRRPADVLTEARWLAGTGRARAVPRQRELDVLRQGPRRPPPARDAAARAGGASTASSGCASRTCSRPRCGPAWSRRMTAHARRRAVLRPVLPALSRRPCCAGCGASAAPRTSSRCSSTVRARAPLAGVRSNVIVGFPGETEADVEELERFLVAARLDVVGVFGFSPEDGTEAADLRRPAARPRRSPERVGAAHRAHRGADGAARRGPARRGGRGARRGRRTRTPDGVVGPGRAPGPGGRRRHRAARRRRSPSARS